MANLPIHFIGSKILLSGNKPDPHFF